MSSSLRLIIVFIAGLSVATDVLGANPAPGEYEAPEGRGTLSITDGLSFHIFAMGANGHYCELDGHIENSKGYASQDTGSEGSEQSLPQCVISFHAVQNGYSVSAETDGACRYYYCGERAWFDGKYLTPPAGCTAAERTERRASFTSKYRAKDYRHAYEMLGSLHKQCSEFMHWLELDDIRNDLAITLYHLGKKKECLAILKETRAGRDELGVLPPADLDNYMPLANAISFNLKLCSKGAAQTQK